ncbi:GntR family transcriptional regulator [uncultured Ezakiella sp.]|uniref:GntR family transcriptional regulator n=1 Tax=uncultured Ezakiella sp. TaxID=1637529 RepID=UPI0025FC9839|nr:GntR family transcriptional regulator [uncultured Ezakiella sp.]
MDFTDRIPIYVQVQDAIIKKIILGDYEPGDKIPSIKDLAKDFKINANTVSKSLTDLEAQGILETRRGMGTYIVEDKEMIDETVDKYIGSRVSDIIREFEMLGISKQRLIELVKEKTDDDNSKNY